MILTIFHDRYSNEGENLGKGGRWKLDMWNKTILVSIDRRILKFTFENFKNSTSKTSLPRQKHLCIQYMIYVKQFSKKNLCRAPGKIVS